jgi:hypothetical protein
VTIPINELRDLQIYSWMCGVVRVQRSQVGQSHQFIELSGS